MNKSLHPAERLVRLRESLGLSQRELAKEFQVSGAAVACWETGVRQVPGAVLRLMELYEDTLPSIQSRRSSKETESLLTEIRAALDVSSQDLESRELRLLSEGMKEYLEDSFSLYGVGGQIKRMFIRRLVNALKSHKGASIKLAQLASFLEIGLPAEVRLALGTLQSRGRPEKPKVIQRVIEEAYGKPLNEVFPQWREKPLAVTSLGQVHYARLPNGDEVAVKVQHPAIREILKKQIEKIELIQSLAAFLGKDGNEITPEISRALLQECDYKQEALNQERFRNIFSDDPNIIVPYVYRELVRDRVLVSEYVKAESFQAFASRAK